MWQPPNPPRDIRSRRSPAPLLTRPSYGATFSRRTPSGRTQSPHSGHLRVICTCEFVDFSLSRPRWRARPCPPATNSGSRLDLRWAIYTRRARALLALYIGLPALRKYLRSPAPTPTQHRRATRMASTIALSRSSSMSLLLRRPGTQWARAAYPALSTLAPGAGGIKGASAR